MFTVVLFKMEFCVIHSHFVVLLAASEDHNRQYLKERIFLMWSKEQHDNENHCSSNLKCIKLIYINFEFSLVLVLFNKTTCHKNINVFDIRYKLNIVFYL